MSLMMLELTVTPLLSIVSDIDYYTVCTRVCM